MDDEKCFHQKKFYSLFNVRQAEPAHGHMFSCE